MCLFSLLQLQCVDIAKIFRLRTAILLLKIVAKWRDQSVRKSVTVFVRIRVVTFTFFGISHGRVNQVVLLNIENHAVQK